MWPQIGIAIIMQIVSSMLMALTAPKPKAPEAGKIDVPTTEEGEEISIIFGTILVKSPKVIGYGQQRTVAIKSKGGKK